MKIYYLINLCIIEDYYANLNTKYDIILFKK